MNLLFSPFKTSHNDHPMLEVRSLNEELQRLAAGFPQREKPRTLKQLVALLNPQAEPQSRTYVIDFDGDAAASGVEALALQLTAIIQVAEKGEEVVLRLHSPGGHAHAYGQCAAELARLKKAGLKLTVCVDQIAASGGYMMAAVADQIIAAPFALIGSIGVAIEYPNFNRLLEKLMVDYRSHTAGKYKRTVSTFGQITPEGESKLNEELGVTHQLFKDHIRQYRSSLDVEKVADGSVWWGQKAIDEKLVDSLGTSAAYLSGLTADRQVLLVQTQERKSVWDVLGGGLVRMAETALSRVRQNRILA